MSWLDQKDLWQARAREITPLAKLGPKDAPGWAVVYVLGCIGLLGLLPLLVSFRDWQERFGTGFMRWIGIPRQKELRMDWLRHECRHVWQTQFLAWFLPVLGWGPAAWRSIVGVIPHLIVYFLLPLPVGLAYGRWALELDAETVAWRGGLRDGSLDPLQVKTRALHFAEMVSGKNYGFAWPRSWALRQARKRALRVIVEAGR